MNFRKGNNGILFVAPRGTPPLCPDGYLRDPGNAYICRPILCKCVYRNVTIKKSSCCQQGYENIQCTVISKRVSSGDCYICKGNPEWIKEKKGPTLKKSV